MINTVLVGFFVLLLFLGGISLLRIGFNTVRYCEKGVDPKRELIIYFIISSMCFLFSCFIFENMLHENIEHYRNVFMIIVPLIVLIVLMVAMIKRQINQNGFA